jgi:hypothetical protein
MMIEQHGAGVLEKADFSAKCRRQDESDRTAKFESGLQKTSGPKQASISSFIFLSTIVSPL